MTKDNSNLSWRKSITNQPGSLSSQIGSITIRHADVKRIYYEKLQRAERGFYASPNFTISQDLDPKGCMAKAGYRRMRIAPTNYEITKSNLIAAAAGDVVHEAIQERLHDIYGDSVASEQSIICNMFDNIDMPAYLKSIGVGTPRMDLLFDSPQGFDHYFPRLGAGYNEGLIGEIKTLRADKYKAQWYSYDLAKYERQMQAYMHLTGLKMAVLLVANRGLDDWFILQDDDGDGSFEVWSKEQEREVNQFDEILIEYNPIIAEQGFKRLADTNELIVSGVLPEATVGPLCAYCEWRGICGDYSKSKGNK